MKRKIKIETIVERRVVTSLAVYIETLSLKVVILAWGIAVLTAPNCEGDEGYTIKSCSAAGS